MLKKTRHDLGCMPWYFPILLTGNVVFAQSGGGYDLTWSTTDSGGVADGGGFELEGTIGAAEAESLSGGGFELTGGFVQPPAGCGACQLYGDVAPTFCVVDVDDILYVLDAFADPVSFPDGDVSPCGGNDVTDVDDILAVLDAFTGSPACADPCPP